MGLISHPGGRNLYDVSLKNPSALLPNKTGDAKTCPFFRDYGETGL